MTQYSKHGTHRLDPRALYEELDEKREREGMSWRDVAISMGLPTNHRNTFHRLKHTDAGVHSTTLITMMVWLGRLDWEDPMIVERASETVDSDPGEE